MRRQLTLVALATSTLITLAFVIPLGFLVQRTAEDRAIDRARADATSIVPLLANSSDPGAVAAAAAATISGSEARMTIVFADGSVAGAPSSSDRLAAAAAEGRSAIGSVDGGAEVVVAVATGPDDVSAVRVFVPNAELHDGRASAWAALAAVGVVLIAISVGVADLLSRRIVRPVHEIADTARRLGGGDLGARVAPGGPDEIRSLAETINVLGARITAMLDDERELLADLSHRLRTPLTHLSLRIDLLSDEELKKTLRGDVEDLSDVVNAVIREARGQAADHLGCDALAVLRQRAAFWEVLAADQARPWSVELPDASEQAPVGVGQADLVASIDVIIENVFRHTDDDAPVTISAQLDGEAVTIVVEDGGVGFAAEQFERGHSDGESTGLGLAIVRETAQRAGGDATVRKSARHGGAAVAIQLPRRIADLAAS